MRRGDVGLWQICVWPDFLTGLRRFFWIGERAEDATLAAIRRGIAWRSICAWLLSPAYAGGVFSRC
jgi:hypothetical protein